MSFDHAKANAQIASIIDYSGVCFVIDGGLREYKGLLDRETGTAEIGDHGYSESREARITVSHKDFPTPPKFGVLLTLSSDKTSYVVGHAERIKSGWEVQLKARDLSTAEN